MAVKVLMVCLGNICRSPLAEGILASKLPAEHFLIDSAGTSNYHVGNKPDKRSIAIAKEKGVDISYQRARQFQAKDFNEFDFIYAMDNSNYKDILKLSPNKESKAKVKLILEELFPGENVDVPDPYYGSENGFLTVYDLLDQACEIIAQKLKNEK